MLDQRIPFCHERADGQVTPEVAGGGMVSRLCGAAEEESLWKGQHPERLGRVRAMPNCTCEYGYALPAELPVVQGIAC